MHLRQREEWFPSATGVCDIRYRLWIPVQPQAALQITHGMSEHIDRYDDFARFMAQNGVLVYGMDLASHGKSLRTGEPRGWFGEKGGWSALIEDMRRLRGIVKAEFPDLPYTLLGHSLGSYLARSYAGRYGADFDAYIFLGTGGANPLLPIGKLIAKASVRRTGGKQRSPLLDSLSFDSYNKPFRPNRTPSDWLSRDEAQVDSFCADESCGFWFTSAGMRDVFDGIGEVSGRRWARRVPDRPILMLAGARDPAGGEGKGVMQVINWLRASGHCVEAHFFEDARHELLNELNRDEVYRTILLFIGCVEAADKGG